MKNKRNVRIKDIAELAGVSIGTVDRVLHNRGRVSPQALKKINEVLIKTEYKPNILARTLSARKLISIAALVPDPSVDEFWKHSNSGIDEAKEEWSQYNIQVDTYYYNLYDKTSFEKISEKVLEAQHDAILSAPIFHYESLDFFKQLKKHFPYVFFNSNIPEVSPLCFIGQDFYQSGRLGAELLDLTTDKPGTFAILHIYEDIHNSVHLAQKERGFLDYFKEKKDKNYTAMGIDFSNPNGPSLEKELSKLLSEYNVKGLLVSTSNGTHMAASYLEKHHEKNIRLVGYDPLIENIKYLKKGVINFLIHQNPKKQAVTGISHLVNYLLFKRAIPNQDFFPLEVITKQNLNTYMS